MLRGFLLFVIPYMAYEAFISPDKDKQAPIVRDAFFRDYVKATGELPFGAAAGHTAADRAEEPRRPTNPGNKGSLTKKGVQSR